MNSSLLDQYGNPQDWSVGSAGTWTKPGLPADARALQDASVWGLDIKAHRSWQVNADLLSRNNLVLVMEAGQKEALQVEFPKDKEKIFLLSEVADGVPYDFPEPVAPIYPIKRLPRNYMN